MLRFAILAWMGGLRGRWSALLLLCVFAQAACWTAAGRAVAQADAAAQPEAAASDGATLDTLHRQFEAPPADCRIMMRWWWFGPAITRPEITHDLERMKAAGIGGVEIATLYAQKLDDPKMAFRNVPFLSPEHLAALGFAGREARRLGLRLDVTLGSGWPLGGPAIPVTEAAGKLRVESRDVAAGATSAEGPFIDAGEELIATFLSPPDKPGDGSPVEAPAQGRYEFPAASRGRTLTWFIASRTGMVVKRPAVGAEGFVLDHYDRAATEAHLHAVGDKLLSAFGDQPPYAVFSDSLEDYASDWTPALLGAFEKRRGYDLRPHLQALVTDDGPQTAAVRHDWGRTLTELADENFLKPMKAWAGEHRTLLRSQTYGFPPVSLYSNRYADLIEGEGKATFMMGREFSDTRWAASAGHLFHHNVVSSETWTWLHSPAFRATPLDMKAEADLHFLQGINQLVGHGWPASPENVSEPGWRMYAAAALNAHNPWFFAMPELATYLQRVSYAMRLGEPANDVAMLLPNDDVWASFKAQVQKRASPTSPLGFDESGSNITLDEQMDKFLGKKVIAQVLDAGFNVDFIDADTIDHVGIPYKVLVLPNIDRLPVATYKKIAEFAAKGGVVIATQRTPATAPGLMHAAEDTAELKEMSQKLFHGGAGHLVRSDEELGAELKRDATPDMKLTPRTPEIGFFHRKLKDGELYFVANTSNTKKHVTAQFRDAGQYAEMWDAMTGAVNGVADAQHVELDLEAYGSRLIYFSDVLSSAPLLEARKESVKTDLSQDWMVRFSQGKYDEQKIEHLQSWTEDEKTKYYSGTAVYTKSFEVLAERLRQGTKLLIDFGEGEPTPLPSPPGEHNMKAYLDAPVREAAEVYVNGQRAGMVWHPPYRLDVTALVKPGRNDLKVEVGNTAINEMAGKPLPDYRLLWDRYGKLFEPQGMEDVKPVPSGLLGPVRLVVSEPQ